MNTSNLVVFAATVLPLVCTPGPDLLYVASQALTGGHRGAIRANVGVISGYVAHAALGAMGVAAIVAASPLLFEVMRWVGVAYLAYLAVQMLRSAMRRGSAELKPAGQQASLLKGFLTSFLNPKGLLVYFAILPNFIDPAGSVAGQALGLSAVFIGLCALVYGAAGAALAIMGRRGGGSDKVRRLMEGFAGCMLAFAAVRMSHR